MLYDNGGHTPPIPQRPPVLPQRPTTGAVPSMPPPMPLNPLNSQRRNLFPPKKVAPGMMQRPVVSRTGIAGPQLTQPMQQQTQQMQQQQQMQRFLAAYGKQGGGLYPVGSPGGQRDVNGNSPGEWDYQMTAQPNRGVPTGMGQYGPPQYNGNPFIPMVLK